MGLGALSGPGTRTYLRPRNTPISYLALAPHMQVLGLQRTKKQLVTPSW